jgi:hypothetical protein
MLAMHLSTVFVCTPCTFGNTLLQIHLKSSVCWPSVNCIISVPVVTGSLKQHKLHIEVLTAALQRFRIQHFGNCNNSCDIRVTLYPLNNSNKNCLSLIP